MTQCRLLPTNAPPDWSPFERKTVNLVQAAQLAGVCRRTIYNWMEAGKVYYVRQAGGAPRIYVDSLFHEQHAEVCNS